MPGGGGRVVRRLVDTARVRLLTRWFVVAVVAWAVVTAAVFQQGPGSDPLVAALVVSGALLVGALVPRGGRHLVVALAAGAVAVLVPGDLLLWPAVTVLVLLAVAEDPARTPWTAWATGLVGSVLSWVVVGGRPSAVPFLAVVLGGLLGLLQRGLVRSVSREGRALPGAESGGGDAEQARWLEQRTSLARELHDVVGHHVTAMVVQAEAGLIGEPERALREISRLGRTALGELDALVTHLRDPGAERLTARPQLGDIDELLAAPLRHQGVRVEVDVAPDLGLEDAVVLVLYRIVQEALTNVTRHAAADRVWVDLAPAGRHVRLQVSDDGVGPPAAPERGSGLMGIEERVHALDGVWTLSRRPGGGTVVEVFVPTGS